MRHKEIRKLKWKNLDLENRVLKVGESKTDAGKGSAVPLTQPAWAALDVWASLFPGRKPEHFVFPACENGRVDRERPIAIWRTAWRRVTRAIQCPACSKLQNPGRRPTFAVSRTRLRDCVSTILRHTAATKLLEMGTPIVVVHRFSVGPQALQYA